MAALVEIRSCLFNLGDLI